MIFGRVKEFAAVLLLLKSYLASLSGLPVKLLAVTDTLPR